MTCCCANPNLIVHDGAVQARLKPEIYKMRRYPPPSDFTLDYFASTQEVGHTDFYQNLLHRHSDTIATVTRLDKAGESRRQVAGDPFDVQLRSDTTVMDLKRMIGKRYRDLPLDKITIRMLPQGIVFEKSKKSTNSDMMMVSQLIGGKSLEGCSFQVLRL